MRDSTPIIIALDYDDIAAARHFVKQLSPTQAKLKVGKEMFTLFGPDWVKELVDEGFDVFLDLKFHDIPNTVAKAVKAACQLGVWMVNVHASGGKAMMLAARNAITESQKPSTLLTAVTVLTSTDQQQLNEVLPNVGIKDQVIRLALLAQEAGVDGVVCSAQEASILRQHCGDRFCLVTPGIRPEGSVGDDQKRTMTPRQALAAGVSYMVIGRPITQAENPLAVLSSIHQSLLV